MSLKKELEKRRLASIGYAANEIKKITDMSTKDTIKKIIESIKMVDRSEELCAGLILDVKTNDEIRKQLRNAKTCLFTLLEKLNE